MNAPHAENINQKVISEESMQIRWKKETYRRAIGDSQPRVHRPETSASEHRADLINLLERLFLLDCR